jgi:hypothetical protein
MELGETLTKIDARLQAAKINRIRDPNDRERSAFGAGDLSVETDIAIEIAENTAPVPGQASVSAFANGEEPAIAELRREGWT